MPAYAKVNRVLVNLINEARLADGNAIHYAVAAGLDEPPGEPLAENEAAVNEFAATQLGAKVGDDLSLTYYQRGGDGQLKEIEAPRPLRIARIVPMTGLGADPTLTPTVEGITNADTIANWHAPQEWGIDANKITPADEEYWNRYKAAPKIFLSLTAAQRMWGQRYGNLTEIRLKNLPADWQEQLLAKLNPSEMGFALRNLRQEQLAAAKNTEFSGLFLALSIFIIVAAMLLSALLLALAVEQRARQHGLMMAVGFPPRTVHRLVLAEAGLLSAVGAFVGVLVSLAYSGAILHGLRTWWLPSVGTTAITLHVQPVTLVLGWCLGVAAALLAAIYGTGAAARLPAALLLCGHRRLEETAANPHLGGSRHFVIPIVLTVMTIFVGLWLATGKLAQSFSPLILGAAVLATLLAWANLLLRPAPLSIPGRLGAWHLYGWPFKTPSAAADAACSPSACWPWRHSSWSSAAR